MNQISRKRIKYLIVLAILLRLTIQALPLYAAQESIAEDPFWLDISLGAPLVDWFNRNARPYDIARIENVSQMDMLDEIEVGRRLVIFKSAAEAEFLVPQISDRFDIIGYNLEHGPANPQDEQDNPVAAVKRLRLLADEHELGLAVGPDRSFALSHGPAIAPYVDMFVLQVQKVQTQPETVENFITSIVPALRQANPALEISMQIRTEGDVRALGELTTLLRPHLDGLSVLTSVETVDVTEGLVEELNDRSLGRPLAAPIETPLAPKTGAKVSVAETALNEPATEVTTGPALPSGIVWLLVVVTSFLAGAIGGAAITSYLSAHK